MPRWLAAAALCVLLVVSGAVASAQTDGVLSGYSLTSWHDGAGRPLGSVYAVVQSNDGYLWIGSDAGLMRFDGWRFFTWDNLSDTAIPGAVKSLAVARAGGLWAGLSNPAAVARVQDGKVQMLTAGLEGLDAVTSLIEDSAGVAWAIADWELYSWRAGRWRKAELPWPTRPGQVRHVFASRSGAVWVGTRWGVFERRHVSSGFQFVSPEHVWGIGEDPAGHIWTTDVAAGFRPLGSTTRPRHPQEAAGHRLVYDRQGVLWVGTFGDGLWRVRPDGGGFSIQRAALRTGLSSDSVLSIMEDRDGNVWAGTTVGLHRLTRRALTPLEGVGFVLGVLDDEAGPLAGTTKGLARLIRTADGWRAVHVGTETPEIRTMYRDSRGVLWAGAADGLWRLVNGRLVQQPLPSPGMLVLSIAPASDGGLWLGDGRWLYKWNGTALEPLTLPPDASLTAISVARFDRHQRFWLGSGNAIGFLDAPGSFHLLGPNDGLDLQTGLHDVIEDDDGNVWLATSKGLSRFSEGRVTTIGRAQGLPGDRIWSIVQDRDGHLWLSLDRGVVRLERKEALLAMADASRHVRYQMFDPMDGLAGAPLGTITSTRDGNGGLWLVRGGGVTAVDPAGLTERPSHLAVRIEEAVANGQRMGLAPATLPAGTRRLEVSFSSLTLAGLKRPRFRYRLDGVDTDWVEAGPRRTVFYTNLAPREYRFRVEAHPEDGTWTTASAEWAFRIQPAFYQTPLFYALCAMAIAAATLLAWRFRLSLVKRQFSLALAERARLSREIHDTLLQSLVGVALQFDGIANDLGPSSVGAREQLTRVRRQVEAYIRDARQSIWDLRSPVLETSDLVPALRRFAKEAIGDRAIRFTSSVSGRNTPRPPKVDNQLLRIGQEAITNAVRHSAARRIHLDLVFGAEQIVLRVSDDGCGFDRGGAAAPGDHHYGLTTMRERAEELDGSLTVTSSAGGGTAIEATVPRAGEIRNRLPAAI